MWQTGDSVLSKMSAIISGGSWAVHSAKLSTIFSFYQVNAFGQEHQNVLSPHTLIKLQFVYPIYQPNCSERDLNS